jgi:hypothetical protein
MRDTHAQVDTILIPNPPLAYNVKVHAQNAQMQIHAYLAIHIQFNIQILLQACLTAHMNVQMDTMLSFHTL